MKKRLYYFDLLKVISAIMVVFIHIISEYWYDLNPNSVDFKVLTIMDSVCRICVPIYFMISGALFLNEDKKITLKEMFKKYILNIFLIFIFWNMSYSVLDLLINKHNAFSIKIIFDCFINTIFGKGIFQLRFLTTILGFYLCVPVLKLITKKENKKVLQYLMIILFIFTSLNTLIKDIININLGYSIVFSGYLLYFILGYYINTFDIDKKYCYFIYGIGLLSLIMTPILTISNSINMAKPMETYLNYSSFNVYLYSASIFLLAKNMFKDYEEGKLLRLLSKSYFGVYLIHGFVLGFIKYINFFDIVSLKYVNVIILLPIIYIISLIPSLIISKIPILKKFIYT